MRRLLLLTSAIVFFDVAFFAAIAPLLPGYVEDLGLSKAQAGILTASYAVGTLLNSLPAGFAATRLGPRRTVIAGLLLLTASSVTFGFAHSFGLLAGARFLQGVSGAFTWCGALTWLVTTAPESRRGAVIGSALGTAVAGAFLGPPLGALASAVGTGTVFGTVAAITLGFALAAARLPDSTERGAGGVRETLATFAHRPVMVATALVAVPSLMFGLEGVLIPLRIDDLGGGPFLIAAGFAAGAALESVLSPLVGRYSDHAGRVGPYLLGMGVCVAAMLLIPVGRVTGILVLASVITAIGAGLCFTPATAILTTAAEREGLHQGFAAGLMNMAWAGGQVLGAVGAGTSAGLFGYAPPCIAMAAVLAVTGALARSGALAQAEAAVTA